jgi:opacity protein-like surface antigen
MEGKMRKVMMLGALVLGLAVVQPAAAQDRALNLSVWGGGLNGLASLDGPGTADFKRTGYNVSGRVGVDLNRYLGFQGSLTHARNELEVDDVRTGADMARTFYDASVRVRYPTQFGLQPYALIGAGAVTLHPVGTNDADATKPAGTVGLGLEYGIPGTSFGFLLEGRGWLYELSDVGGSFADYDKTQFDMTWSAGLSYRFPF